MWQPKEKIYNLKKIKYNFCYHFKNYQHNAEFIV